MKMRFSKALLATSSSILAIGLALTAAPAFAADSPNTVSEVVVTGLRASLDRAITLKRETVDQMDAVSAEDIGKLPDKNVADALQRIPGVNTVSASSGEGGFDENDRVSIRGTNPSLTDVTVNGHDIATGDWFILDQFQTVGRSVSFTLMPAEIVNTVETFKSQSADIKEGGVAGSIDILTRDPLAMPKSRTMEVDAEGEYSTLRQNWKPQVSGLIGWKNDAGNFGIIAQAFYEARDLRRDGQEFLGYSQVGAGDATGAAIPSLVGKWYPNLIGSALFEQQRVREGGDLTFQWRPNDQWDIKLDGFYSHLNATNYNANYMFWGTHEFQTNVPTSWTVTGNTITAVAFPLNNPNTHLPVDGVVVDNIYRPDESAKTYYVNLDAAYHASDRLNFKFQAGYTAGEGLTPRQPAFEVDGFTAASYAMHGYVAAVSFPTINPSSPAGLSTDWNWNDKFTALDHEGYAKIDGTYDWDDGAIKQLKFGVRWSDHTRDVTGWVHGCSINAGGTCWGGGYPFSGVDPTGQTYPGNFASTFRIPGFLTTPAIGDPNLIAKLELPLLPNPDGGPGCTPTSAPCNHYYWPGSFKVQETDWAGYLMANIGGDRWRGNMGVRLVDSDIDSLVNVSEAGPGPGVYTWSVFGDYLPTHVKHNYFDVLPSINLSFDVTDKLLLRVSANETMARPDYSALAGSVSLTDLTLTGNGGNPNLKPIKSANFDVGLEWYYAPSSLLSVHAFYMDLQNYVAFGNSQGNYFSQFWGTIKTFTISTPVNSSGTDKGFEVSWQQPVAHFEGGTLGFLANYTYADGTDKDGGPLVGDSRNTYNLTGYWDSHWVTGRLAYTYRSSFLVGLDRSTAENQDAVGSLDASVNINVTPNVSLVFDGLNLTDSLLKYYAQSKLQPRAIYDNGRQFFFGIRAKY
jgi:iron complex outermembrane receptor protein